MTADQQQFEAEAAGFPPAVLAAIADLQKAYEYARRLKHDPWDFAVELEYLVARGATVSDLRFLLIAGYVEHAHEITQVGDPSRRYEVSRNLAIGRDSCFVATEAGLAILGASNACPAVLPVGVCGDPKPVKLHDGDAEAGETLAPHWDATGRVLTLGGQLVKRYRVPSPNQQVVLGTFEEEGWPRLIYDPLPFAPKHRPKERLHATIRCLNANQENRLIRFRGNGTGEAVPWEPIAESAVDRLTAILRLRRAA